MSSNMLLKKSILKIIFFITTIVLSCGLFVVACLFEYADVQAQQAYVSMDKWQKAKEIDNSEEWRNAFLSLQKARRFNPYSVDYMLELGQLYEWAGRLVPFTSDKDRALQRAKNTYRLTVEKRPTWPHCWANLAYVKMVCNEWDDELFLSITKAIEYGPWIKEAQQKIIFVGLTGWDRLPAAVQNSVVECITKWFTLEKRDGNMERFILQTAVKTNHVYVINHLVTGTKQQEYVKKFKAKRYGSSKVLKQYLFPIRRFKERFEV